jgi:hypothetical protein
MHWRPDDINTYVDFVRASSAIKDITVCFRKDQAPDRCRSPLMPVATNAPSPQFLAGEAIASDLVPVASQSPRKKADAVGQTA